MIGTDHDITEVRVVRFGVLHLTFADGLTGEVDLTERLRGRGGVFKDVGTPEGFAKVKVDPEFGSIGWPGEVDLAPDTLYLRVKTGEWPTWDPAAGPEP
jgi:hypothetical protein